MQELLRVKAAYDEVDSLVQNELGQAVAAGDAAAELAWGRHKSLTDYAYFVVLFSQLERIVKAKFSQARDQRRANPDWTQRRGWDGDLFNSDRVPFSTQLASVLDRQDPAYGKVLTYYQQRNHIAHGGLTPSVGSVDVFVQEIITIIALLRA